MSPWLPASCYMKLLNSEINKLVKNLIKYLGIASLSLSLSACEKEVNFDLGPSQDKIVIEGSIETGLPPYIFLTKSMGFFGNIDLGTLSNSFIHDAHITVSDGDRSFVMKEYALSQGAIPFYFYSIDSDDNNTLDFRGTVGKTYTLTVEVNGGSYTSNTAIPAVKPLDSLWAIVPTPGMVPDTIPDAMFLYCRYTDPDTIGNRSRYYIKRNSSEFLPPMYSVDDDAIVNGTTVDFQLMPGINKMDTAGFRSGYFRKGDTVVVKWCAIDKGVFDFWRTLEFSFGATGNPFASPVEVTTNIQGGALGVWAGYGPSYDTLIIPH